MAICLCSLREVSNVLHSGSLEVGCHAGVPEGHSPQQGSYHVHVCNPGGLVLDYLGSIHCCHCGSHQCIWLPWFWGSLNGSQRGQIPQQAGCIPLKPGGSATFCTGSGDSSDDVESYFSCLHSSALWHWALLPPALWLWHHCLNSQRVRGACLVGITVWEVCSTSIQPGKQLWGTSPFSFSSGYTGGTSGSSVCPLAMAVGVAGSSLGSSIGVASYIDATAGALFGGLFCGGGLFCRYFCRG